MFIDYLPLASLYGNSCVASPFPFGLKLHKNRTKKKQERKKSSGCPTSPKCTHLHEQKSNTSLRLNCAAPALNPSPDTRNKRGPMEEGGEEKKKKKRWRERQERKISSWLRLTIANSSFPLGREGTASSLGECTLWSWAKRSGGEHPQPIPTIVSDKSYQRLRRCQ